MVEAFEKLGIRSYHFTEITPNQRGTRHMNCWLDAMQAKVYGKGKPYTSEEFDKILKNYGGVTDAPCANFPEELMKAYPNAKVVLTTRDPKSWLRSMEVSYYTILGWRIWPLLRWLDPNGMGALYGLLKIILDDWTNKDWQNRDALLSGAQRHNDHIRAIVPKEKLLEFRVQQGWDPLCKFLGKEVPAEQFPHANGGKDTAGKVMLGICFRTTQIVVQAGVKYGLPFAALAAGWYFVR
jgi:hypothetical protein